MMTKSEIMLYRKACGLSQIDLAKLAYLSKQEISQFEKGDINAKDSTRNYLSLILEKQIALIDEKEMTARLLWAVDPLKTVRDIKRKFPRTIHFSEES